MTFFDPSVDDYHKGEPSVTGDIKIMSVTGVDKQFSTDYEGFVGLAPYTDTAKASKKADNFMYQLKYDLKAIDHLVAGVYMSNAGRAHIKFGSHDKNAMAMGTSLSMMKTRNLSTWAVKLYTFESFVGSIDVQKTPHYALFEPQLPYIYIPEDHFLKFMGEVSSFYQYNQISCNYQPRGQCYFKHSCNHVKGMFNMGDFKLRIGDDTGSKFPISFNMRDVLVPGHHLGGQENECFIGIFSSKEIE